MTHAGELFRELRFEFLGSIHEAHDARDEVRAKARAAKLERTVAHDLRVERAVHLVAQRLVSQGERKCSFISASRPPLHPTGSGNGKTLPAAIRPSIENRGRVSINKRGDAQKISDYNYARAGIRYYWILDPQLRTLEILELEARAQYRVAVSRTRGKLRIPGCPGLVLSLDDLWAEVDEAERQQAQRRKKR